MNKLKQLTETLEAKHLCMFICLHINCIQNIDTLTVIDSTMKMLIEINNDDKAIKNFIICAKESANL